MIKKSILLVIIIISQLLTGCWDQVELNQIAIVSGIALDKMKDGKIRMTLLIPISRANASSSSSGGSNQTEKTMIISENGEGIMDTYEKVQEKLLRKIFLSQIEGVLIGESLAREGVSNVLDFFSRYRESKLRTYIFFTKGEQRDIFKTASDLEKNPIDELSKEEKLGIGIKIDLKDFLNMMTEKGQQPIAAEVGIIPLEVNHGSKSKNMYTAINGSAIFYKDKLIGWMDNRKLEEYCGFVMK